MAGPRIMPLLPSLAVSYNDDELTLRAVPVSDAHDVGGAYELRWFVSEFAEGCR